MLTLTLATFIRTARSQSDLPQYVVAPSENVLLAVASQPDCPLLIEEPMLLIGAKPGLQPIFHYQLRNISEKTVLRYSLVFWTSNCMAVNPPLRRSIHSTPGIAQEFHPIRNYLDQ